MRDVITILILGFIGIKGILWLSHDTAPVIASRHWVSSEAVIDMAWLESTYAGRFCRPCYSLRTTYHFNVDGVQYEGDQFEIPPHPSGGEGSYFQEKLARYAPGAIVQIVYDPKNPNVSAVMRPQIDYPFTIWLGGFSLLALAFAVWRAYSLMSRLIRGDGLPHAT